jgi:hypothetical protein
MFHTVEPTRDELAVLERQRRAFLAGDREALLGTFDPAAVFEFLSDWPGVPGVEGPAAAWDQYAEFMEQFEQVAYEHLNIERRGRFTLFDVRFELVGRVSGAPMELF